MNATQRKAAQKTLQEAIGALTRQTTDLLNQALQDNIYEGDLPQSLRRVLSTNQLAAQEYGPAPQPQPEPEQ